MSTLGSIEEQLMRSWIGQAWHANVVAETEAKVAGLREKVVIALNTGRIAFITRDMASVKQTVKEMMTSGTSAVFGEILPPPSLSPYFVGRQGGAGQVAADIGAAWKRWYYSVWGRRGRHN